MVNSRLPQCIKSETALAGSILITQPECSNFEPNVVLIVSATDGATATGFVCLCLAVCGKIQMQSMPLGNIILGLVFLDIPVCITIGDFSAWAQPDCHLSTEQRKQSPQILERCATSYCANWMPIWVSVALRGAVINSSFTRLCKPHVL